MRTYALWAGVVPGLLVVAAGADDSPAVGVYEGTLGAQAIVLDVSPIQNEVCDCSYDGRYFYRRHGVAIPLKIERLQDGKLRLREYSDGNPTGAEWLLTIGGDKASKCARRLNLRSCHPIRHRYGRG